MLAGDLDLMGLPKWLPMNLIAAWKTASREGVAVLFEKEPLECHISNSL
jgi:hypothetical protein